LCNPAVPLLTAQAPFVHVKDIVTQHWSLYGRNFYCRYDYEGVDAKKAAAVLDYLRGQFSTLPGSQLGGFTVSTADEFTYLDPIDGSVSRNQGIRVLFRDGSRIVFRLSGTAGSGATIRMYIEKYEADAAKVLQHTAVALKELVDIALKVSDLANITGFTAPSVIT
jgi:phosphoglucomutase